MAFDSVPARDLPLSDRVALRFHMAMCQACPRFERQLLTMRNAMKQWRNYADADEEVGNEKA